MAEEPASKRQRVGAECTMSLTVSGTIILEGQSVGELLLDLKARVYQLEERAKHAEAACAKCEATFGSLKEVVETGLSKLSDEKADKAVVDAELKKVNETLQTHAKAMQAELEKQQAASAELERQKAAELAKQRAEELEKQRVAELERQQAELQKQKAAELEKQQAEELEKQKAAELEKQRAEELEKQRAEELERQKTAELEKKRSDELEKQRVAEVEKQKAAELEKQKAEELVIQKAAEVESQRAAELAKQRAADLEKQKAAVAAVVESGKSGKEFLDAQVANLSDTAKKAYQQIDAALKHDIEFTQSSSNLTPAGKKIVKKVFDVLKSNSTMAICVEGHTGCRCIAGGGPPKRGQKCKAIELSDDRAAAVIDHLRSLGCKNALKHRGHGCVYRVGMTVKVFPAAGQ